MKNLKTSGRDTRNINKKQGFLGNILDRNLQNKLM